MHKFLVPKSILLAGINKVRDSISSGRSKGGWLTAHQPTKNQALIPSLSTHLLVPGIQKKSLPGAGGVFLITRGKQEVEALAQGEATAH